MSILKVQECFLKHSMRSFDCIIELASRSHIYMSIQSSSRYGSAWRTTDIEVNFASAQEHVPEVERCIRTVKECYHALVQKLPYHVMLITMIVFGIKLIVHWLNSFPVKGGILNVHSPQVLFTQCPIDFQKQCTIEFGSYVQAIHENKPTNTPASRSLDGIYLGPLDNIQGGHSVLNLKTGKVLTRHKVRVVPLPDVVRDHVVALGVADGIKPATTFHTRKDGTLINLDDVSIPGVNGDPQNNQDIEEDDGDDESYNMLSQDDESIGSFEDIDEDELKEIKDLAARPVEANKENMT